MQELFIKYKVLRKIRKNKQQLMKAKHKKVSKRRRRRFLFCKS